MAGIRWLSGGELHNKLGPPRGGTLRSQWQQAGGCLEDQGQDRKKMLLVLSRQMFVAGKCLLVKKKHEYYRDIENHRDTI